MRTACYARFSSDLQKETSAEDQIRACREYAERQGWAWQDSHVYTDAAVSGSSIDGRAGLQQLLADATNAQRRFDVVLVDDSSRVARDLADALRIVQRLKFADVRIVYISQGIDSDSEQAETLVAVHGIVDSLYLREMAAKIKRGLKGQIGRGFATGGRTYGYRTVAVHEANTADEPIGYRVKIDQAEAAGVRAIFQWYGDGVSIPKIISRLTDKHFPAPRGGSWRVGAVRRILRNTKYLGRLVWGKSQQSRKPGTRTKVVRPLPEDQWQVIARPELRIISDDLWERVQARIREWEAVLSPNRQPRHGGLMRGRNAQIHASSLFSGFLKCGVCGGAVHVIGSHLVKGVRYRYYGCASASRNGDTVCTNRLKVRLELADRALLAGLQRELLHPETVSYIADRLAAALNAVIDQRPAQRDELTRARHAATAKIRHLVAAVEAGAGAPTIFQAIKDREAEIRMLDGQLEATSEPLEGRMAVIPGWVRQQLENVAGLVAEVPELARAEFRRLNLEFALNPVHDEGSAPFLRAVGSGDFEHLAFSQYAALPATVASHLRPGE